MDVIEGDHVVVGEGRERFDIRFWRDGKDTVFKVLAGNPDTVKRMGIALSGGMTRR